jgi:hypothetical protein
LALIRVFRPIEGHKARVTAKAAGNVTDVAPEAGG